MKCFKFKQWKSMIEYEKTEIEKVPVKPDCLIVRGKLPKFRNNTANARSPFVSSWALRTSRSLIWEDCKMYIKKPERISNAPCCVCSLKMRGHYFKYTHCICPHMRYLKCPHPFNHETRTHAQTCTSIFMSVPIKIEVQALWSCVRKWGPAKTSLLSQTVHAL